VGEDSVTKAFFDASIQLVLGDGATFLFWVDAWLEGARLADIALDLVAASTRRCWRRCTVVDALQDQSWMQDITRALSFQVLMQYIEVRQRLQAIQLIPGVADKFIWRWEPEHVDHLVVRCVLAREAYFQRCGWQLLSPSPQDSFDDWWLHSRKSVSKPRRPAFDSLVLCVVLSLWLHRNACVFRQAIASLSAIVDSVWAAVDLWIRAGLLVGSQLDPEESSL
jgi:hypothetical protein